jgi:NTE family protein
VSIVDTSEYEPFNLYLSDKQKIELFIKGYRAGKEFLKKFNWHDYKELRKTMAGQERA